MLFLKVEDYVDENGMTFMVFDNQYFADFISLAGIALIIFLSHLSYQYFEKRFYIKNQNGKS
jgi:peptidoglycan/LPS O-acetylase OafA/YrhL